jgi:hypothetical protein
MKTTYIVLIGVVGVGAVGAYMYMKNKKAQDNLLSGSLPATTPTGTPSSGTPPKGTPPIVKEVNLDEVNFNTVLNAIKNFVPLKAPNQFLRKQYEQRNAMRKEALIKKFAELGYKFENGLVIKI